MQNNESQHKPELKKRAYNFAVAIVKFLQNSPNDVIFHEIKRQLLRSATSIGANITEAQAGSSKKDFTNFFSYALKSANETRFWLSLTKDTIDIPKERVEILLREAEELSRILGASVVTLKGRKE